MSLRVSVASSSIRQKLDKQIPKVKKNVVINYNCFIFLILKNNNSKVYI